MSVVRTVDSTACAWTDWTSEVSVAPCGISSGYFLEETILPSLFRNVLTVRFSGVRINKVTLAHFARAIPDEALDLVQFVQRRGVSESVVRHFMEEAFKCRVVRDTRVYVERETTVLGILTYMPLALLGMAAALLLIHKLVARLAPRVPVPRTLADAYEMGLRHQSKGSSEPFRKETIILGLSTSGERTMCYGATTDPERYRPGFKVE